jgi:hypothetical protein
MFYWSQQVRGVHDCHVFNKTVSNSQFASSFLKEEDNIKADVGRMESHHIGSDFNFNEDVRTYSY